VSANLDFEERDASDWARNVVAIVPGSDPTLKGEYVLVSAHNDHIGFNTNVADHDSLKAFNDIRTALAISKRPGDLAQQPEIAGELAAIHINVDSLHKIRPARKDSISNGADDDGSGSIAILEIAEYIAKMPVKPRRSTLFVWQTGEEAGLNGSAYFATHPTVPADSIVADINIDMIGRGRAEDIPGGGPTYVGVVGSGFLSKDLAQIVAATNLKQKQPLNLDPKFDLPTIWPGYNNIYGRSDHFNYARQCIPIAFFFTGLHGDYHQRTDEPQYIDYPHYSLITNYIRDVILELDNRAQRPSLDKPCTRA
jgi:Peptidase family M28